jgi:hypothetical protein
MSTVQEVHIVINGFDIKLPDADIMYAVNVVQMNPSLKIEIKNGKCILTPDTAAGAADAAGATGTAAPAVATPAQASKVLGCRFGNNCTNKNCRNICIHFLDGNCTRKDCSFHHWLPGAAGAADAAGATGTAAPAVATPAQASKVLGCRFGNNCTDKNCRQVCTHFLRGKCTRKDCLFHHWLPVQEAPATGTAAATATGAAAPAVTQDATAALTVVLADNVIGI